MPVRKTSSTYTSTHLSSNRTADFYLMPVSNEAPRLS